VPTFGASSAMLGEVTAMHRIASRCFLVMMIPWYPD
jgi:hypothetical protein